MALIICAVLIGTAQMIIPQGFELRTLMRVLNENPELRTLGFRIKNPYGGSRMRTLGFRIENPHENSGS